MAFVLLLLFTNGCKKDESQELKLEILEKQLIDIDTELSELSNYTLRSGLGNIGWISTGTPRSQNQPQWIEIQLPDQQFDCIVLVPVLWNDAQKGLQADGFPEAFHIVAGNASDSRIIATIDASDEVLPRIAPLIINLPPTKADWIRVKAVRLSKYARNKRYLFKLSEIMVFSGEQNIALNRPVRVSSTASGPDWGKAAFFKEALVDGLSPFLMDASGQGKVRPYLAHSNEGAKWSTTLDLGKNRSFNSLRLHSAFVHGYIPQMTPIHFGIPKKIILKAGNNPNSTDMQILLDKSIDNIYRTGNIMEWHFPKVEARYVSITIPKHSWRMGTKKNKYYLSFDEIEILSDGHNISVDKPFRFAKTRPYEHSKVNTLTDGKNHFGDIITTRKWMEQLARRHQLEKKRPILTAAINQQYHQQKSRLKLMSILAAILAIGIVFIILIARIIRMRAVLKTREGIAANLHDELSANLHALALLGEMAQKNKYSPDRLSNILGRIHLLSLRSREAARHCTNMLQAKVFGEDLKKEMIYLSEHLLSEIKHDMQFDGEEHLSTLKKHTRNDLFLYYKECLTNIVCHAEANECSTHLQATHKKIILTIADNGVGISQTAPSLQRRARLLRAHIHTEIPAQGGTRITLSMPIRKRLRHR